MADPDPPPITDHGLTYAEVEPSGLVASYVTCVWTLEGRAAGLGPPERILPDGHPELVWNLADPFLRHAPGAPPRRQAAALVVGQILGPLVLQPTGRIDLLGVRFRPEALGAFLGGVPTHELTDRDVAVEEVLGRRLGTMAEEASEAPTAGARVALVLERLETELRRALPIDRRVADVVVLLGRTNGDRVDRVDRVATMVGLGTRQLERLFLERVGIGPKRLARIARFQGLVSRLGSVGQEGWAALAIRCGYFDQAHLIRDFREFAGEPPAAFLRSRGDGLTGAFLE